MQEKALIGACMAQLEKEVPQQFEQTPKCLYFTMQEKTQIDACMKQLEKEVPRLVNRVKVYTVRKRDVTLHRPRSVCCSTFFPQR